MSDFIFALLQEERKRKRNEEEEEEDPRLVIYEQSLYFELSKRYAVSHPSLFEQAPLGFRDPKARNVLVALLNLERQEHAQRESDLSVARARIEALEKELEVLRPIASILETKQSLENLVFTQQAELKRLKAREDEKETLFRKERETLRREREEQMESALAALNAEHWKFLDETVEKMNDLPDFRDQFIEFVERMRLIVLKTQS